MSRTVSLPTKVVSQRLWAEVSSLGPSLTYEVVGEVVHPVNDMYSFAGGHRVRLYRFKKNVHFRVPDGVEINISSVAPAEPARRQPPRR